MKATTNESSDTAPGRLTPVAAAAGTRRATRPPTPPALADVALIDGPGAAAAACISISQWHALVAEGDAPRPAFRGIRCTRWKLIDVRAWLIERAAGAHTDGGAAVVAKARKATKAAQSKRTVDNILAAQAAPK